MGGGGGISRTLDAFVCLVLFIHCTHMYSFLCSHTLWVRPDSVD